MTLIEPLLSGAVAVLAYVALLHGGTAVVSRGRALSASFGLLAALGAAYVFFGMQTYLAADAEAYAQARFWHLNAALLLVPALAWFVQAYTALPYRWPAVAFAASTAVTLAALHLGWLGRPAGLEAVGRVELPWGEVVARKGPAMERGRTLMSGVFMLLRIFVLWAIVHEFTRGRRGHALLLAGGILVLWIDSFFPVGGALEGLPWDEIGFLGLAIIMGIHLSTRAIVAERAERDLEESRERLRLLTENAPYGILLYDAGEERFTVVNSRAEELLETPRAELLRASPPDIWREKMSGTEEFPEELAATYTRALEEGRSEIEWGFTHPDGNPRVWVFNLVRLSDGDAPAVRIGIHDVTELRASEERTRKLEEELQAVRRLEAVGRLAGGVAHDFNNLLGVIIGNLEILRSEAPDLGPDGEQLVGEAVRAVERGSDLTRRLGTFARRSERPPEPVDVESILVEVASLVQRTLPPTIRMSTLVPRGTWPVLCQPGLLQDALINLCFNARDALVRGGAITISTDNVSKDREAASQLRLEPGDYVQISVEDNGEGMSREVADRVLEPFFTTKGPDRGAGLGLSMVWGFVEQSGGGLDVSTREGVGTTVRILLPRLRGDVETPNSTIESTATSHEGPT